jgi:hypothetical protein
MTHGVNVGYHREWMLYVVGNKLVFMCSETEMSKEVETACVNWM